MKKILEIYNLPRLNQEERDNQTRPVTRSEIEFVTILIKVIIKTPSKQKSRTRWLHRQILPSISKREIRRTISFTTAPKATKYQGINLSKMVKDLHSESYKTLRKEMKDHKQKEECIVLMD